MLVGESRRDEMIAGERRQYTPSLAILISENGMLQWYVGQLHRLRDGERPTGYSCRKAVIGSIRIARRAGR